MDTEQKNILDGVIDLHVHTAPDVIHRTYNDLELTDAAVRAGARAIAIKGHHCGTVARARRCATHIIGLSTATIRFICTADWF